MKRVIFSALMVAGFVLAGVGCSNKCPESLESDAIALAAMPATNKTEIAAGAKKCDELVDKYKSNDRCHNKDNQPFQLENLKKSCAALHTAAK